MDETLKEIRAELSSLNTVFPQLVALVTDLRAQRDAAKSLTAEQTAELAATKAEIIALKDMATAAVAAVAEPVA